MLELVEKRLESFIEEIDNDIVKKLYKKLSVGKRLRSKLILKIAQNEQAIELSAIVEMIHTASLLHDDVIDEADTRRGVASINALYGNKDAIMLGDILYSFAYSKLVNFDKRVAKVISNAVTSLSIGEMLDVKLSESFQESYDIYLDMIYKKTASLIEASAQAAAIISTKDEKSYGLYGKNLGLAFQIVDDILDVTADEKILGKPAFNDFKEGKTTLPYILLYQKCNDDEKKKLKDLFKKELSRSQIEWIKEMFKKYGAIDESIKKAKELGYEAINVLQGSDKDLQEVVKAMIERDF